MKIIIVHPFFNIYGGAERTVIDLFVRLKQEYEVQLYTLYQDEALEGFESVFFSSKKFPSFSKFFGFKINPFNRPIIKSLARKMADSIEEKDILIITNFPASLILSELIKIKKSVRNNKILFYCFEPDKLLYYSEQKKLGILPKDMFSWKLFLASKLFGKYKKTDRKIINTFVDEIFTMSDSLVEAAKKVYPVKKVFKPLEVYVNLDKFKQKSREKAREVLNEKYDLNLNAADFVAISVGRLEKGKGLEKLLEHIKNLSKKNMQIKLLVAGTGSLLKVLNLKGNSNVFVLGFLSDDVLNTLYCAGNLFIFLGSNHLAGPLTLVEAMCAQNLVIASKSGSPKEIIQDQKNGFLVDPNNRKEVLEVIQKCYFLWKSGKSSIIEKNARKTILQKFEFEKVYKKFSIFLKKRFN